MNIQKSLINIALAQYLVTTQFPQWKDLSIQPIEPGGWDNKSFRLGKEMLVRMPSAAAYAAQGDPACDLAIAYQALYGDQLLWARPILLFHEKVLYGSQEIYRVSNL